MRLFMHIFSSLALATGPATRTHQSINLCASKRVLRWPKQPCFHNGEWTFKRGCHSLLSHRWAQENYHPKSVSETVGIWPSRICTKVPGKPLHSLSWLHTSNCISSHHHYIASARSSFAGTARSNARLRSQENYHRLRAAQCLRVPCCETGMFTAVLTFQI